MDGSRDFIHWLGQDMSLKILMCLKEPSYLIRTSAVSHSWCQFVITNGLCKKLCLKMFPEASSFARVIEITNTVEPVSSGTDGSVERAHLEREHRVYASLYKDLTTSNIEICISEALCASSTDNYPEESINNTLEPTDRFGHRASYWSSKGESNPSVPEILIYKLSSQLCVVTEFHVHPFQAYFQFGFPIYSAKAVRFQIGHPKDSLNIERDDRDEFLDVKHFRDDEFVWTYGSPEFPMLQENWLQTFKLPEPVLCIGGILRVELLGRVQTQEMDGQYYICDVWVLMAMFGSGEGGLHGIADDHFQEHPLFTCSHPLNHQCINHVQIVGRTLSPAFDVEMTDEQGKYTLKYNPDCICNSSPIEIPGAESSGRSHIHRLRGSVRTWEQMIRNTFRGAGPIMIDDYDSEYENVD
ncbi:hypothetical protein OROGR_022791 [Orobanche gracilis]